MAVFDPTQPYALVETAGAVQGVLQGGTLYNRYPPYAALSLPAFIAPGGGGGGAATVADGADVAQGAAADAASAVGGAGTTEAKLRLITTQLDTLAQASTQLPATLGATTAAASLSVVSATDATSTVAQASNTSGQLGTLIEGAVTTAAPTYTTAKTYPLSLDTAGSLRVNVTAGGSSGATATPTADTSRVPVSQMDGVQVTGSISAAIPTAVVTVTAASPGVVTWTAHGRSANDALIWTTGGTVPTPLVPGNTYYVKTVLDANTFTISLTPGGVAINTGTTGSGTQTLTDGILFTQTMDGYSGISVATPFTAASYTIVYEESADYTNWYAKFGNNPGSTASGQIFVSSGSASNNSLYFSKTNKVFRARISVYTSGSMTATGTLISQGPGLSTAVPSNLSILAQGVNGDSSSSPNSPFMMAAITKTVNRTALATDRIVYIPGTVVGVPIVKLYSIPEAEWVYAAAASGIVNTTTAVTVVAAAAAGIRNYITSLQLVSEALGAATEFAIRDGAAGTVLWRIKIGAGGLTGGFNVRFPDPLKGTAATLLEVVTLTASVTGAVYCNLQGYQAP